MTYLVSAEHAEYLAVATEKAALSENFAESEKLARELVEVLQVLYGPLDLEVSIAQFYLALALEEQGKIAEAMAVRKQARKILLGHKLWKN